MDWTGILIGLGLAATYGSIAYFWGKKFVSQTLECEAIRTEAFHRQRCQYDDMMMRGKVVLDECLRGIFQASVKIADLAEEAKKKPPPANRRERTQENRIKHSERMKAYWADRHAKQQEGLIPAKKRKRKPPGTARKETASARSE